MRKGLLAVLALFACANLRAATLFSEDFEKGLTKRWEAKKFEGLTQYTISREGNNSALQARANSSASGLGVQSEFPVKRAQHLRGAGNWTKRHLAHLTII